MEVKSAVDSPQKNTVLLTVIGSDGRRVAVHVPANLVKFKPREAVPDKVEKAVEKTEETEIKTPEQPDEEWFEEPLMTNERRLNWSEENTFKLIEEIHKRVATFVENRRVVYNAIAEQMNISEKTIEIKYKNMVRRYNQQGEASESWVFFDKMHALMKECQARKAAFTPYAVPDNVEKAVEKTEETEIKTPAQKGSEEPIMTNEKGMIWSEEITFKLIEEIHKRIATFAENRQVVCRAIAEQMNIRAKTIEDKFKNLVRRYNRQGEGGEPWVYFDKMHALMQAYEARKAAYAPYGSDDEQEHNDSTSEKATWSKTDTFRLIAELHKRVALFATKHTSLKAIYRAIGAEMDQTAKAVETKLFNLKRAYRRYGEEDRDRWPYYDAMHAFMQECEARKTSDQATLVNEVEQELARLDSASDGWTEGEVRTLIEVYFSSLPMYQSGNYTLEEIYQQASSSIKKDISAVKSRISCLIRKYNRIREQRKKKADYEVSWPYFHQIHHFMKDFIIEKMNGKQKQKVALVPETKQEIKEIEEKTQDNSNSATSMDVDNSSELPETSTQKELPCSKTEEPEDAGATENGGTDATQWSSEEDLKLIDEFSSVATAFYSQVKSGRFMVFEYLGRTLKRKPSTVSTRWKLLVWRYRFYLRRRDDYEEKITWQPYFDKMHAILQPYDCKELERVNGYYEFCSKTSAYEQDQPWPYKEARQLIDACVEVYEFFNCDKYDRHLRLWVHISLKINKTANQARAQWAYLMRQYREQLALNHLINTGKLPKHAKKPFDHFERMHSLLHDAVGLRNLRFLDNPGEEQASNKHTGNTVVVTQSVPSIHHPIRISELLNNQNESSNQVLSNFAGQGIHIITPITVAVSKETMAHFQIPQRERNIFNIQSSQFSLKEGISTTNGGNKMVTLRATPVSLAKESIAQPQQMRSVVNIHVKRPHTVEDIDLTSSINATTGPAPKRKAIRTLVNSNFSRDSSGRGGVDQHQTFMNSKLSRNSSRGAGGDQHQTAVLGEAMKELVALLKEHNARETRLMGLISGLIGKLEQVLDS